MMLIILLYLHVPFQGYPTPSRYPIAASYTADGTMVNGLSSLQWIFAGAASGIIPVSVVSPGRMQ
jgi:hypothetical protein